MENNINGIFIIKRGFGNTVELLNKNTNSLETVDYFKFKDDLVSYFSIDTINNILENINCGSRVLIDFTKKVAKLITEKEFDFNKVINSYFDPKVIENELLFGSEDEDELYAKFQRL